MDKIIYNANIYTMDESNPQCEALAINNDEIILAGTNEEVLKLKTKDTELIDLQGKTVLPGFNDSHLHILSTGLLLSRVNLKDAKSIKEVINKLSKAVTNDDKWLIGRGWNQDYFTDEVRYPTKAELDQVSKNQPIIIFRACGHVAIANSKAIELANIDVNMIVSGGMFDLDTGLFAENAIDLIAFHIPELTYEDIKSTLLTGLRYASSNGITSVQSDDFSVDYKLVIKAYHELEKEGLLPCKVYEQCLLPNEELLNNFIDDGYYTGWGSKNFQIGPLKLLADGSLGARTAALRNPYTDNLSTKGILTYTDIELYNLIKFAHLNKMQIAIHAIGDKAMEQVLDQYEKVLKDYPKDNHRHGIVHCQITDLEIIDKLKKLNVIAYIQPIFIHYDHQIVASRVGERLAYTSYAFKSMIDKGVITTLGTDCPVEDLNPYQNIYCAVTRKSLEGKPVGGYNPNEALSVYEAVKHYTYYSSYASFMENKKGLLKQGYEADFIVINLDIFKVDTEKIKDIKTLMTFCGGRLVYKNM